MHIELIDTTDGLEAIAQPWRSMTARRPFCSPDWLIPWWRHLSGSQGQEASWRLATVAVRDDAGELVAVAPWYRSHSRVHGQTLRFLGTGSACSDYLSIPTRDGAEQAAAEALADWLCGGSRHRDDGAWDLLLLEGVDLEDGPIERVLAALEVRGALASARPVANCWRVALPADWESYVAQLSKLNRKRVRRIDRNYLQSGRARVQVVSRRDELARVFPLLVELHTKRWKSRGGPGIFAEPGILEFHIEATERLLAAGQLWLSCLEIDGQPAAAEYCLSDGQSLYSYQSGLDPELASHEPGTMLVAASIQIMIQQGYAQLDFLRGDEPYKSDWRAQPHAIHDVRILPGNLNGHLRQSLWQAATNAKEWLRAGRDAVLSGND